MAKPPKKPKDPARPTRAKASRPVEPATTDALADLLNPAINKGTAGLGSGTGLQPPPDNSFDRRADFSAAHKARKSTPKIETRGFEEAPQRDYAASPITGLDPALEKELGLDTSGAELPSPLWGGVGVGGDAAPQGTSTTPLPSPPPQGGREKKKEDPKYRLPRADLPTQPGGFAGMASQQSL